MEDNPINIFSVFGSIGLKDDGFVKGITEATETGKGFELSFSSVAAGIGNAALAISGAAIGVATAMGGIAISTASAGDQIDKASQKLGLSRQSYQEWDYILKQSGASIDSLGVGMKTLTKTLSGAAEDGSKSADAFAAIGISFDEIKDKTPEEAFEMTIAALQKMPPGADKSAAAIKLLGKQGMELAPLLNKSSEEIDKLRSRAHELGVVMDDEVIDSAVTMSSAMTDLKTTITGVKNQVGAALLPSMSEAAYAFVGFITGADDAKDRMDNAITGLVETISKKLPKFVDSGAKMIISLLQGITTALPQLVSGLMEVVPTIITALITLIPDVIESGIKIIFSLVDGIASAIPELIPVAIDALIQLITTIIDNVDLLIDAAINIILALVNGLIIALPILIEKAPEIIIKLVTAIIKAAPKLITAAWELITTLAKGILSFLGTIVDVGKDLVTGLWDGIVSLLTWVKDKIVGFFGDIIKRIKAFLGIGSSSGEFANMGKSTISDLWNGISSKISGFITNIQGFFSDAVQKIKEVFSFDTFKNIGINIIEGAWNGITSMANTFKNNVTGFFGGIVDSVKGVFDQKSPSRVFAEISKNNVLGFINQLWSMENLVDKAINDVFGGVESEISQGLNIKATALLSAPSSQKGSLIQDIKLYFNNVFNINGEMDIDYVSSELAKQTSNAMRSRGLVPQL